MSGLLDRLRKNRKAILLTEMAGLVHDLDKFRQKFLDKPQWHTVAYRSSNHKADESFRKRTSFDVRGERWNSIFGDWDPEIQIDGLELRHLGISAECAKEIIIKAKSHGTVSSLFAYHHFNDPEPNPEESFPWLSLLIHGGVGGADGIDSELDKIGNPTNKEHHNQKPPFRIDTPFCGHQQDWADRSADAVDAVKMWFWAFDETANGSLRKVKQDLEGLMSQGLAETRYPCNDVTLWAHSYSVASMTKALLTKVLMEYPEAQGLERDFGGGCRYRLPERSPGGETYANYTDFTLLRISWDRDFLMGRTVKTGDICAVDTLLEKLQDELKNFLEEDCLVGNEVYRDESTQLFLLPTLGTWFEDNDPLLPGLHQRFENEIRQEIEDRIHRLLIKNEIHEYPFDLAFSEPAKERKDLKEKKNTPAKRLSARTQELLGCPRDFRQSASALLALDIQDGARCGVCGVRPVMRKKISGKLDEDVGNLCSSCAQRRHDKENLARRNRREFNHSSDLGALMESSDDNRLVFISAGFDIVRLFDEDFFSACRWTETSGEKSKQASPGRLSQCYDTMLAFFRDFQQKEVPKLCPRGLFPITLSPTRVDFIVAGKRGEEVISCLREKYEEFIGPYRPSLPLSVGAIFFYQKFPLYLVQEAAKGLRQHLRPDLQSPFVKVLDVEAPAQNESSKSSIKLKLEGSAPMGDCSIVEDWALPLQLSDEREDFFHYLKGSPAGDRKSSWLRAKDLSPGDSVEIRDGRFDFILLDSPARRFAFAGGERRDHFELSRPAYSLHAWQQFERIQTLMKKLDDSQLASIEEILVEKRRLWRDEWTASESTIRFFCESVLLHPNAWGARDKQTGRYRHLDEASTENPVPPGCDRDLLLQAALSGLLLDAFDLYRHVMGAKNI